MTDDAMMNRYNTLHSHHSTVIKTLEPIVFFKESTEEVPKVYYEQKCHNNVYHIMSLGIYSLSHGSRKSA